MAIEITQIDAFTNKMFRGNPAAVCLLDDPKDDSWMQSVAAEMNLSETAYLVREPNGYNIRWFTPVIEVDLCGHATVAAAHYLYSNKIIDRDSVIQFSSRSGPLSARFKDDWITLNFPSMPPKEVPCPAGLKEALGTEFSFVGKTRFDYLVEVKNEDVLLKMQPNFDKLCALGGRGFIVTARSSGDYDFKSRCFFPNAGVNEDPVTGSAHCALAPYWSEKLGKSHLYAYQASSRGGALKLTVEDTRVNISGQAVTTFKGQLIE